MSKSKIEWTERVWNPVTGCTKCSQGCKHCYAERIYERFNGKGSFKNVICHADRLDMPLRVKKPSVFFVNSMSDLFHEDVPFSFVTDVFRIMEQCPQHTFQVLTKRSARMREFFQYLGDCYEPLPNVWLGVSVEHQAAADERVPDLLRVPAAVRWLSCEPLLGYVQPFIYTGGTVDWIVAGGESGPGARPMKPEWIHSIRIDCNYFNVPFFFKQWGEHNAEGVRVGKHKSGHLLMGREYRAYPKIYKNV